MNYALRLLRPQALPTIAVEWMAEVLFAHATLHAAGTFPADLLPMAAACSIRGIPFTSESLAHLRVESAAYRAALLSRWSEVAGPVPDDVEWLAAYLGVHRSLHRINADTAVEAMDLGMRGLGRGLPRRS